MVPSRLIPCAAALPSDSLGRFSVPSVPADPRVLGVDVVPWVEIEADHDPIGVDAAGLSHRLACDDDGEHAPGGDERGGLRETILGVVADIEEARDPAVTDRRRPTAPGVMVPRLLMV